MVGVIPDGALAPDPEFILRGFHPPHPEDRATGPRNVAR